MYARRPDSYRGLEPLVTARLRLSIRMARSLYSRETVRPSLSTHAPCGTGDGIRGLVLDVRSMVGGALRRPVPQKLYERLDRWLNQVQPSTVHALGLHQSRTRPLTEGRELVAPAFTLGFDPDRSPRKHPLRSNPSDKITPAVRLPISLHST
jgi:hypothetical protein